MENEYEKTNKRPVLQVKDINTTFYSHHQEIPAVRGVDLTVNQGDIYAVVGESGSGKSVFMKSIMDILPENAEIQAGELTFMGKDLLSMDREARRKLRGNEMAMIFQDPMTALNPVKKIGDHLIQIIRRHQKVSRQEAHAMAIEALDRVGIPSPEARMDQYPHEFSGGMRQRVMIAMALTCHPDLLIADEPTTALDVTIQAQIMELLKKLRDEEGMSIVLITHDLGVVASVADRIAVMYCGKIMETGLTDEIFYQPAHPYTQALLRAVPKPVTGVKERLEAIPGSAPSLLELPQGCPFQGRCVYSCELCAGTEIPLHIWSQTQTSRCIFTREELTQKQSENRERRTDHE